MTKQLFKLKKDGKCVGYIAIGYINKRGGLAFSLLGDVWSHIKQEGQLPQFDEACIFVAEDKNGEKVFAGDRMRRVNGEPCFVEWFPEECRYILRNNENCYDIDPLEWEQSELIKEKP